MSHPINDSIFERISEEYQILKLTVEDYLEADQPLNRFAIRDSENELVRHNNKTFFATQEEAEQVLCEIVQKKFEEQCR